jgi:DNA-binding CsgD family transcriptional regulator
MASSIGHINKLLMPETANRLTPKQIECLALVAEGMTSKEIARELGISSHTVDDHVEKARIKLNAPTRLRAAALFRAQLATPAETIPQKQDVGDPSTHSEAARSDPTTNNSSLEDATIGSVWAPQRIGPEPAAVDEKASAAPTDSPTPMVNDGGQVHFGHFPTIAQPQSVSARSKDSRHQPSSSLSTTMRILTIAAALALIVLAYPQLVQGAEVIAAFILKTTSSNREAAASR